MPSQTLGNEEHITGKKTTSPSMTTGRVDCALLAANHEVIDVARRESHSGNSHGLGLVVHQLHALLPKHGAVTLPVSSSPCQRQHGKIIWLSRLFAFHTALQKTPAVPETTLYCP